jgi:hypothetical protein
MAHFGALCGVKQSSRVTPLGVKELHSLKTRTKGAARPNCSTAVKTRVRLIAETALLLGEIEEHATFIHRMHPACVLTFPASQRFSDF